MTAATFLIIDSPVVKARRFMAGMAYRVPSGHGLLSGTFPLSMLTNEGSLPSQAEIRILYRPNTGDPGDGVVVATATCNADGTWQVSGLNEFLKYDIVARIPGFSDVIIPDVQPAGAPLTAYFVGIKEEYEYEEEVSIQVIALGGRPPYVFEAVSLPEGLNMSPEGVITGSILSKLNVSFDVTITDSESTVITLSADSYVLADPHWDKVVALLHFDDGLKDEAGGTWTGSAVVEGGKLNTSPGIIQRGSAERLVPATGDFTIEASIVYGSGGGYGGFIFSHDPNSGGVRGPNLIVLPNRALNFGVVGIVDMTSSAGLIPIGVETHVAVVRQGSDFMLFIAGQLSASTTFSGALGNTQSALPTIGRISTAPPDTRYIGLIDEFRITSGVARYTEDFDPPTKPFPNF